MSRLLTPQFFVLALIVVPVSSASAPRMVPEMLPTADIETTITVSSTNPTPGETITADLTMTNRGPGSAYSPYLDYEAWDGVRVVDAVSPGCQVSSSAYWARAKTDLLTPGESRTLTLRLRCDAAGRVAIWGIAHVKDDPDWSNNRALVYFDVPGTPLPDLYGRFLEAKYFPIRGAREWREVWAYGHLELRNRGTAPAGPLVVRFYLIEYATTYRRRLLIGTRRSRGMGRYGWDDLILLTRIRLSGAAVYDLEAEIDPAERIAESEEANNTAVSHLPNADDY